MMMQATQTKRRAAVTAVRRVVVGLAFAVFVVGVASAVSAARARGGDLFPDLKIGLNIRW
ncbi:hypothetical protein [Ensifer sp.]|uniref:hypothetical protein n=1 Tax=Ensifer sp. TaxID=1872086 RepID=UPI0028968B56|nr:hypothetical protein [Ensifer sp.]